MSMSHLQTLRKSAWALCACLFVQGAQAQELPSFTGYGGVGLIETRSARFMDSGAMDVGAAFDYPTDRYFFTFQPFDWMEASFRFSTLANFRNSGERTSDRSFDLKFRLIEESEYWPQVAVGLQDIGGTGLFSGEYLVASRRFYSLDFSLGVGWGTLGSRGMFKNPFRYLSDHFDSRVIDVGLGGKPNIKSLFTGQEVSLFGGIEYHTPVKGLRLKAEYDGNDYLDERRNPKFKIKSPVNVAASYRPFPWLDLTLGFERGAAVTFRASIFTDLDEPRPVPDLEKLPEPIKVRQKETPVTAVRETEQLREGNGFREAPAAAVVRTDEALATEIMTRVGQAGFTVEGVTVRSDEVIVFMATGRYRRVPQALGRAARVINNVIPDNIEVITISTVVRGVETKRVSIMRSALEAAEAGKGSVGEIWHTADIKGPVEDPRPEFVSERYPGIGWSWAPKFRQSLFDPDDLFRYQVDMVVGARVELTRNLRIRGAATFKVFGNLDEITRESDSRLPRVRSDFAEYLREGENGIANLKIDYTWNPGKDLYARVSAGYFERMFGGVGGEILWAPLGKRWAVGADLNQVWQRDFDLLFDFRDYNVLTGHVNFYYELRDPRATATIRVGRYLAKDFGATFQLSRLMKSGARVGAFFTLTDVPFSEFGEGSFDKGIFISLPLDMFLPRNTKRTAGITLRPLTRDGGQRLSTGDRLYGYVRNYRLGEISDNWDSFLD